MITRIENAPANVAAFRATGKVEADDYKSTVIPAVDALVKMQDRINFMLMLDNDISDFSLGAIAHDLGLGLKHFTKWHRMAIVSDSDGINAFTNAFSYLAPGEAKGFKLSELAEATAWVSS